MKLNDIPECERCCGVDIDQLEADLKTAHEMIREFREVLEFYGRENNWVGDGIFLREHNNEAGKRARAVLQKWQGKLGEMGDWANDALGGEE